MGSLPLEDPILLDDQVQHRTTHRGGHHQPVDSLRRRVVGKTLRPPKSLELIPPSKGWMCEGDEEEKEIGRMKPSVEKEEASEKEEEEEDPEEEEEEEKVSTFPLPMDVDADKDYLQYLPEYSPVDSGHASVPDSPEDSTEQQYHSHDTIGVPRLVSTLEA
ncbi:hypothetical protein PIB30_077002 [Stylosanthes scabra]|uniref:Uncharacterized protein n=1 Tax=Stylosanthes scabra TaxID=79078 RepID=A0ABU6XSZ3_9FABA|nr:hypothetical protein [Stylosanthes scabra]